MRGLSSRGSRALEHRLSSCGTWIQLLHGMWDLPRPGLEPMSPALAGGFLTTAPPGKPYVSLLEELPNCFPQWQHHFTFPQAMYKDYIFSTSLPTLVNFLFFFFLIVILVGLKWYLTGILIYICLMINDVEYIFICLLDIFISFLENYLVKSFSHF